MVIALRAKVAIAIQQRYTRGITGNADQGNFLFLSLSFLVDESSIMLRLQLPRELYDVTITLIIIATILRPASEFSTRGA